MAHVRALMFCLLWSLAAIPASALAQTTGAPAASPDPSAALIKELKEIIGRGEKERLADPFFLRDLRELVRKYEYPWHRRLLFDEFSGPGPEPSPPWQVTAGEYLIDWRHGLRSVVKSRAAQQPEKPKSKDQATAELIGTILQQALGDRQQPAGAQKADPGYAAVIAPVVITNAFALELELTSRTVAGQTGGRLELGPYRGAGAAAGYRLVYSPAAAPGAPSLELLALAQRGTVATLERYDQPLNLEDGAPHSLVWTRDAGGLMIVLLDGRELFRVTDRSFQEPFDGLAVINGGGDFALRRVVVEGTG